MGRISQWLLIAIATVLLATCASEPQIRTDYDKTADFSRYRTFAFAPTLGTDNRGYSTLISSRLKEAAQREMTARGYVYDENNPDLLVNFINQRQTRYNFEDMPAEPYMFGHGLYGPWPGYVAPPYVDEYTEGTLTIDLVDRARKQLVWEGIAAGLILEDHTDIPAQDFDKVVTEIFAKYPFQAGKT